jgi:hypothetical protein
MPQMVVAALRSPRVGGLDAGRNLNATLSRGSLAPVGDCNLRLHPSTVCR